MQWLFDPERVIFCKLMRPGQGCLPIPDLAGIDQHIDMITSAAARFPDQSDILLLIPPHRAPAEFDGCKTLIDEMTTDIMGFSRCLTEEDGGIGPETFGVGPS